ncbi:MAG TPA: hypothetical protein VFY18_04605 [Candidatus Limnocylindrales bacterium]|nr:hypothetical protein [Candidatus Limnocylindrales bacterium]
MTAADAGASLGKALGPGQPLGTLVCEWRAQPGDVGAELSLLVQPLPDAYCEPTLSGSAVTGFGRAATWEYSDSFDVPQGTLSACVTGGLISITRTGHVNDPPDESGYRLAIEQLMTIALGRLR